MEMKLESNNENVKYIFGSQLFLGYIKFYDNERKFGYIVSNNYGMNHNRNFNYKYPNLYIDHDSFEENVKTNRLIIFRPLIINDKIKAGNIRQYNPSIHKDIAIQYILHNNNIHIVEKKRYSTAQYDINIYAISGVHKYELIQECCELYKRNGAEALLHALYNYFSSINGVCTGSVSTWDVWHKGRYNFEESMEYDREERENEEDAFKRLFDLVDKLTAKKIVLKHASLQYFAPYDVLLSLAGELNDDYRIPKEVREVHHIKKLQCIIEEKKVFQCFYDEEKNRDEKPNFYHRRNLILLMLKDCPKEIKDSIYKEVIGQINEGIERFITDIEHKTRTEKKELLKYFADYIDDRQKAIIEESVEINDYLERLNSDLRLTFSYYPLDFDLNSITKQFYQQREFIRSEAKPILVDAIIQKIDIKLNKAYAKDYDEIIDIVNSNRFILEECQEQALSIIKNKFRAFCEKELFSRYYSDKLPIIIKKLFGQEEIDILLNSYSEKVLSTGNLSDIHRFFNVFGLTYPMTYREMIMSRDLAGLLDCGDFFSSMPDYGCSLLGDIFDKIRANTNDNGDFLPDFNIQSDRCRFLLRLINTIKDKDTIKSYFMTLSSHDRIVLTLSRKIGCFPSGSRFVKDGLDYDLIKLDEVKIELQSMGADGNNDDILQNLSQSCIAIAEIILSSECEKEADIHNVLLWLRKYYTIENRNYKDWDERNYYEEMLLMYFAGLERNFHIDVKSYGLDLENNLFPLSYGDYKPFIPIIVNLAKAKVENCNSQMIITIPKEIVADDGIRNIIEKIFETRLENRDDNVCLKISNEDNIYTSTTILSYITLNILNNLHLVMVHKKDTDIIPFDNYIMTSYITSIFNMEYNVGGTTITRFKWDGSEDSEIYWEHIVIHFDSDIDEVTKSIILKVEPRLKFNNITNTFEYHDGPGGYEGNGICGPIGEMTIRLFGAYKGGILRCHRQVSDK